MIGAYVDQEKLSQTWVKLPLFNYLWKNSRHFRDIFIHKNKIVTNRKTAQMNLEDRQYLKNLYAKHNQLLSQYLNIDLSFWQ